LQIYALLPVVIHNIFAETHLGPSPPLMVYLQGGNNNIGQNNRQFLFSFFLKPSFFLTNVKRF